MTNLYLTRGAWCLLRAAADLNRAQRECVEARAVESDAYVDCRIIAADPFKFGLYLLEEERMKKEALVRHAEEIWKLRLKEFLQREDVPAFVRETLEGLMMNGVIFRDILELLERVDEIYGEVLVKFY